MLVGMIGARVLLALRTISGPPLATAIIARPAIAGPPFAAWIATAFFGPMTAARARGGRGHGRSRPQRIQIVGTSGGAGLPVDAIDLTLPTVLVFGNEAEGLTSGYRDLCDFLVRIPMYGEADSINVACAAAILLYEVDRQRRPRRRGRPQPTRGSAAASPRSQGAEIAADGA